MFWNKTMSITSQAVAEGYKWITPRAPSAIGVRVVPKLLYIYVQVGSWEDIIKLSAVLVLEGVLY